MKNLISECLDTFIVGLICFVLFLIMALIIFSLSKKGEAIKKFFKRFVGLFKTDNKQ